MMYFKTVSEAFDGEALADLRGCADALLAAAKADRTSLVYHLAGRSHRALVNAVLRRFYAGPLPGLFAERHGTEPALNLSFTTIRLQAPDAAATRVGWHMDLNFVRDAAPFLVAWVPLEDVGTTRVGLEVCLPTRPVHVDSLLAPWRRRARQHQSLILGDEDVIEMFGADGFRTRELEMAAGGAAVFNQFLLHRTQVLPAASGLRRSFEFRMVDLDALPKLARRAFGVFCRRDPQAPGGIEYLVKQEGEPARPVDEATMDSFAIRRAGAQSAPNPAALPGAR